MYLVKLPKWLRVLQGKGLWEGPLIQKSPAIYLSFDDGPHPEATPFILDQLKKAKAQGTFFCLGKNVATFPKVYQQILEEGHRVGNHTYHHLNGWKTPTAAYLNDVKQAELLIASDLFRPPYGRIKRSQVHALNAIGMRVVYWTILSGDFDTRISPEQCLSNVLKYLRPGAIVVFHDSEKAKKRLFYALPKVIEYCQTKGWQMASL